MITAYYNEFDPKAAAWLRQLIKNGSITQGEVDERSITEVDAVDLIGFDRCHFFAGIGTWDYCLNESGWGDKPIWTASLPCQPFSAAGKGLGKADERHLLPHFLDLVKECRPAAIIGEQVAAAIGHGWLDDLYAEMEACDYAIGSAVIGAHSVNSPHIRQRLYWVAHSQSKRIGRTSGSSDCASREDEISGGYQNRKSFEPITGSAVIRMADSNFKGSQGRERIKCPDQFTTGQDGLVDGLADTTIAARERAKQRNNGESYGREFNDVEWIYCRDNKYRPVKPGIQPLVNGITGRVVHSSDPSEPINANETQEARVMRLKGYGNAIQAQTAIAFISAYMSTL